MSEAIGGLSSKLKQNWKRFLRRFAKWIDPKLEPYRATTRPVRSERTPENPTPATTLAPRASETPDTPQTRAELLTFIRNVPMSVLTRSEREMISAVFKLPEVTVSELMLQGEQIFYVDADEVLGPLTLDRLYKSGLEHFPVVDRKQNIIGCVHTTYFNNLELRESSKVSDVIDPGVYYLRPDYTLEEALHVFLRNGCHFCLVVNNYGKIIGMLTLKALCQYIFGNVENAGFSRDNDRLAVAKRQFIVDLDAKRQKNA